MIRILQKENRVTKIIFAVIIGAAVISMVAYLIPGVGDAAFRVICLPIGACGHSSKTHWGAGVRHLIARDRNFPKS